MPYILVSTLVRFFPVTYIICKSVDKLKTKGFFCGEVKLKVISNLFGPQNLYSFYYCILPLLRLDDPVGFLAPDTLIQSELNEITLRFHVHHGSFTS